MGWNGLNEMDWGGSKGSGVKWRRKKESGLASVLTIVHRTESLLRWKKMMMAHTCEQ